MLFAIIPYEPRFLPDLYRICLLTGDSALYCDPDLLGHYFAAPYAVLEPAPAFVLTDEGALAATCWAPATPPPSARRTCTSTSCPRPRSTGSWRPS